jgi:hypothetical protein
MESQSNSLETVSVITNTLMMEAEPTVSEMFDWNSIFTWLIAQEDFNLFSHDESLKFKFYSFEQLLYNNLQDIY